MQGLSLSRPQTANAKVSIVLLLLLMVSDMYMESVLTFTSIFFVGNTYLTFVVPVLGLYEERGAGRLNSFSAIGLTVKEIWCTHRSLSQAMRGLFASSRPHVR